MKFVAITACPTGIAHTYMAAEALTIAAKEMGHEMKVETQGSVGAENVIEAADLNGVTAVIIAADTKVDKSRFEGLPIVEVPIKDAIKDPKGLISKAAEAKAGAKLQEKVEEIKAEEKQARTGAYKHLMTGVSFMIPFVVAGGILLAIGFAIGGIYVFNEKGTFGQIIFQTGQTAFGLMIPVLGGYIAYSIADRPGLVPGFVGGALASTIGAGFLGALLAGFIAGYTVVLIKKVIKLPKSLEGLMPVLIIPVLATLVIGLVMLYLGSPITFVNKAMSDGLMSLNNGSRVILGLVIGLMMAFDMGGPVNKAAYVFGTATLATAANGASPIMAAVMAAGMVPPLGLALATTIAKNKFTLAEREAGKAAWALGISFITEGAIPFAAADPIRVIPSIMAGSAVTGMLSMFFNCTLKVPHGGIFVLAIPGVVGNLGMYIVSIVVGTAVSAGLLTALKKKVEV
jgi:PTS system fructose-specific IIC component